MCQLGNVRGCSSQVISNRSNIMYDVVRRTDLETDFSESLSTLKVLESLFTAEP